MMLYTPAFFEWNPITNNRTLSSLQFFTKPVTAEELVYLHDHTAFFYNWDNMLVIPSRKGFPLFGGMEISEWKGAPADFNTLIPEFYTDAPIFHIYNLKTKEMIGKFGNLDDIFRHHCAGYRFTMLPSFDADSEHMAYSCGSSGLVHIARAQNPSEIVSTIKVFDVDTVRLASNPGTAEYLNLLEKKVFTNYVNSIKLSGNTIAVISTENGTTWLRQYSLNGKYLKGGILDLGSLGKKRKTSAILSQFYIYDNEGSIGAYAIYKKKGKSYLAMFDL